MEAIERNLHTLDWVTLLLLLCFIFLVFAKRLFPARFNGFIMLFATNKYMLLKSKDFKSTHPFNVIFFVINVISVSLLIYFFLTRIFNFEADAFIFFLQIATAYTFFVLVKFTLEKIISDVFSIQEIIDQYLFHKLSYRNFIALSLLPFNLVFFYIWEPSLSFVWILVGAILFFNALVLVGFYTKIRNQIFSKWFYFIVYLCALEIAPYFISYKLFTKL